MPGLYTLSNYFAPYITFDLKLSLFDLIHSISAHPFDISLIPNPIKTLNHSSIPRDEVGRLEAVRRYDILNTPPDGAYDRITALAARLFQVPIAIVSIVDSDRIWFKSHHGLDVTQVGRDPGLCASAILQNGPYLIQDAATDARTLANPLVAGELGLRFYVGVPLTTTDGFNLGTLCVIDKTPRILKPGEMENLQDLASLVMDQLELRLMAIRMMAELDNAKRAAEKASAAKTEFISTLSHELRTPLASILGFAQVLNLNTPPFALDQEALIRRIIQAGWHLSNLINETLDLSMIESGNLALSQESLSLFEILRECHAMMESQAQTAGIQLCFPSQDDSWFIYADRVRTKQVMINLLSNAIKYNRAGGTVVVECTRSSPERTRVSVTDTGFGLSSEKLSQLFQAFNRLGQETGSKEGTGIGLTLTKKLIEMMGGTMGAHSTPGVGSIFWIELVSPETPLT